jgi:DNA invertase Pin-like site-specific DNA recombinase
MALHKDGARAVLYHRVSTLDQDERLPLDELRAAAAARGLDVVLEIAETGSGARNDRPGLQRVLEAARRGKIDAVLVHKLDRFGRGAFDLLANIRTLEDAGVRFVAVSQGLDIKPGGDPMSRLILAVLAGVAEFERSLIVERTLLGLAKARRDGKRLGRPGSVDAAAAIALRAKGATWRQIGAALGCAPSAAWRAAKGRSEKGVQDPGASSDEKGAADDAT